VSLKIKQSSSSEFKFIYNAHTHTQRTYVGGSARLIVCGDERGFRVSFSDCVGVALFALMGLAKTTVGSTAFFRISFFQWSSSFFRMRGLVNNNCSVLSSRLSFGFWRILVLTVIGFLLRIRVSSCCVDVVLSTAVF
jgi:hypothetical protein